MIFYHYEFEKRPTAPDSAACIATLALGDLNPRLPPPTQPRCTTYHISYTNLRVCTIKSQNALMRGIQYLANREAQGNKLLQLSL